MASESSSYLTSASDVNQISINSLHRWLTFHTHRPAATLADSRMPLRTSHHTSATSLRKHKHAIVTAVSNGLDRSIKAIGGANKFAGENADVEYGSDGRYGASARV